MKTYPAYASMPFVAGQEDFEYETNPVAIPALISTETTPAAETLYVTIDLGLRRECFRTSGPPAYECVESLRYNVEPETGIFFPATHTPNASVDLLIYLHGHKTGYVSHGHDMPIHRFWNGSVLPNFAFREILNNSGRNMILVAPTLGTLSQAGSLVTNTGFSDFISKILLSIKQYGSLYAGISYDLSVGNIILAAHSGGGEPMRRIARLAGSNAFADKISECWGFDCTYSSRDRQWYDWASSNPSKSLYLFSIPDSSTARNAAAIQNGRTLLSNIHLVSSTTTNHNSVPALYLTERLAPQSIVSQQPIHENIFTESGNTFCTEYGQLVSEATLRQQIVNAAVTELQFWQNGPAGNQIMENTTEGMRRITSYWSNIPGAPPHTVPATAWSAVFVSTCVKLGVAAVGIMPIPLQLASAHFRYAKAAFNKRFHNPPVQGYYWAYDPAERVVQPGDIIVKERRQPNGQFIGLTFHSLSTESGASTHGDIVTDVQSNLNSATVVGGNVSNSVNQNTYILTANGKIDTTQNHYSANRVFAVLSLEPLEGCIQPPMIPRNSNNVTYA